MFLIRNFTKEELLYWFLTLLWQYILNMEIFPLWGNESFLVFKSYVRASLVHSGWESACQCRGHGFEPWSGRIPHAAEQLGPWATTTEPVHLEPVPATREAAIVKGPCTVMKSGPRLPQLEKALAQNEDPTQPKINK